MTPECFSPFSAGSAPVSEIGLRLLCALCVSVVSPSALRQASRLRVSWGFGYEGGREHEPIALGHSGDGEYCAAVLRGGTRVRAGDAIGGGVADRGGGPGVCGSVRDPAGVRVV